MGLSIIRLKYTGWLKPANLSEQKLDLITAKKISHFLYGGLISK